MGEGDDVGVGSIVGDGEGNKGEGFTGSRVTMVDGAGCGIKSYGKNVGSGEFSDVTAKTSCACSEDISASGDITESCAPTQLAGENEKIKEIAKARRFCAGMLVLITRK